MDDFQKALNTKREILVDGQWLSFDWQGLDTVKSREWYVNAVPCAKGSFPVKYNGVLQTSPTSSDTIFYRKATVKVDV